MTRKGKRPENIETYLTVGEAASMLGVSRSTLRNWDRAGKVRAYRHPVNGYRLYREEELIVLLEKVNASKSAGDK